MKITKTQTGFTAVIGLFIVVIVVMLGFAGWRLYQTNNAVKSVTNNSQASNNFETSTASTPVPYRTLDQGDGSSNNLNFPAQNRVIKSSDEWRQFWKELYFGDAPEPPADSMQIDFDAKMVVAVVMGSEGKVALNAKRVNIERIESLSDRLAVQVTIETWGDNCVTPGVMTNPYHIVETAKTSNPVDFKIQKTVKNCQ